MSERWRLAGVATVVLLFGIGVKFSLEREPEGVSFFQKSHAENLSQKAKEAYGEGKFDEALRHYTEMTRQTAHANLPALGYLGIGDVQFAQERLLEAKHSYEKIIHEFPGSDSVALAQERLGKVNMSILFSPVLTPMDREVEVRSGDTLAKLAKSHGTTVDLLMKANLLKGSLIRPGMKLKVPSSRFSIIVDKSQNTLALKRGEEIFKLYTVATGVDNTTPVGTFKITHKLVDPVWYTLGAVVPPESPKNVLGSRWLGMNISGYGIHGTRDPASIGKQSTKGCVRMFNQDVEELYTVVPMGTNVTIID